MHDEVYRVLRDRGEWLTVSRIAGLLGSRLTPADITKRIHHLRGDFFVEERTRGGHTSYKLGDWKAFQGQENHQRHAAFAERATRAKIS
jgi:DNA (cytosine-5)-methyltransferase 1